jgi:pyruvyltransferase
MIRMHWWQGGRGAGNFGDQLAPALVRALSGEHVEYAAIEKCDLLAGGSLLEPWLWPQDSWLTFAGHIWGAGRLHGKAPLAFPRANLTGVRGELTLSSLGNRNAYLTVTGAPALLCGHVYNPLCQPRFKLGIWPHWTQFRNPTLRSVVASSPEITLIDPCGGIRETLSAAANCECIAASALHGLIVADAFGIPSCWFRLETGNEGEAGMPLFKYLDYFSAFQTPPPPSQRILRSDTLDTLLPLMNDSRHQDAARLQDDLLASFPYRRIPALI